MQSTYIWSLLAAITTAIIYFGTHTPSPILLSETHLYGTIAIFFVCASFAVLSAVDAYKKTK